MKDIEIFVQGKDEAEELNCDTPILKAEELRTITTTNVSWLLVTGWMFYFGSLLLNLAYYMMHPSSPEMWTWGAVEELERWTPPGERETRQSYNGHKSQAEATQIELTELLPPESDLEKSVSRYLEGLTAELVSNGAMMPPSDTDVSDLS